MPAAPLAAFLALALSAQFLGGPYTPPAPPTPPVTTTPPQQGDLPRDAAPPPTYGAAGSSEITAMVGFSAAGDWSTGFVYRRFFLERLAPGLAATYSSFDSLEEVWVTASLRLVLLRIPRFALNVTPQAARVLVWNYSDGWAVGGSATALYRITPLFALDAGVQVFRLLPDSFADSVSTPTTIVWPVAGIAVFL